MEDQNKCFKVDPEFEREERQLVQKTADLLAQEFCPAESINIIQDEHLEKTGQLAREFQRSLGERRLHFIGLNPKAVKKALELEKQTRGDGIWSLAWTLSHELGHAVWGISEKLANEYAERILKRVEKKIPGWKA